MRPRLSYAAIVAGALPFGGAAQELDAAAEAGRLIFEGVTIRQGCARCHGTDTAVKRGGDIRGKTALNIRTNLMSQPTMWAIS